MQSNQLKKKSIFNFSGNKIRYWLNGSVYLTHTYNTASLILPVLEKYFIECFQRNKKELDLEHEKEQELKLFIQQEASHGIEHQNFNHLLEEQGYPVKRIEKMISEKIGRIKSKWSVKNQFALIAAAEHLTHILSHCILKNPSYFNGAQAEIKKLWEWHATEEIEHKSVALNVYIAADGGYWRRISIMILVSIKLFYLVNKIHFILVKHDKELWNIKEHLRYIYYMWFKPSFMLRVLPYYLEYYLPTFHPAKKDDKYLIEKWREKNL